MLGSEAHAVQQCFNLVAYIHAVYGKWLGQQFAHSKARVHAAQWVLKHHLHMAPRRA